MAGHTISVYLHEYGYNVTTFSTKPFNYCKNINGDATNKDFVVSMLQDGNYDVIINCIGILNQECDKQLSRAVYLNSYLPHLIADTIRNSNTKLLHMSTDCVFSGSKGMYRESDFEDAME